jgi:hypothetical protein
MADYFTNFSLNVPLPDESAQVDALKLAEDASAASLGEPTPADFPASLTHATEDWVFETVAESSAGTWGLWLHSSSGGIDAVCAFIQHLLRKFQPGGCVSFEWSHDCTKPRTDAFGGGAAFITARQIKTMSTGQWLHRQAAARTRQPPTKGETQ